MNKLINYSLILSIKCISIHLERIIDTKESPKWINTYQLLLKQQRIIKLIENPKTENARSCLMLINQKSIGLDSQEHYSAYRNLQVSVEELLNLSEHVWECSGRQIYHWAASRIKRQGFLGRAELGSSRTALDWFCGFADGRRRPRHFYIAAVGRSDWSKRPNNVDWLAAIRHWAWSQREHFLTGLR